MAADRIRWTQIGSGWIGPDRIGFGWVQSGQTRLDRIGSGRVGSDRVSGRVRTDRIGLEIRDRRWEIGDGRLEISSDWIVLGRSDLIVWSDRVGSGVEDEG